MESNQTSFIRTCQNLVAAEMEYAYFNALRTTSSLRGAKGVSLGYDEGLSMILDSGRPEVPYYNRVVIPPDSDSVGPFLDSLSAAIRAVELLSPQQTEESERLLAVSEFSLGPSLCYLVAAPAEKNGFDQEIARLSPDESEVFFDLLALSGVNLPPEVRDKKRGFYCTERFRCYVAYTTQGDPAGLATMFVGEKGIFFANSWVRPEFRRLGFHSALLLARLNDAIDLGASSVFTDVEPASQSHRNCERSGFRTLTTGALWQRRTSGWREPQCQKIRNRR